MARAHTILIAIALGMVLAGCSDTPIITSGRISEANRYVTTTTLAYALPQVKSHLQLKRKDKAYSLIYVEEVAGPDPANIYKLDYEASGFSDDLVKITTTNDGLLLSIDVTNEDKTGAFLVELVDLAKQAAKAGSLSLFDSDQPATPEVLIADMFVDLTNDAELGALQGYLNSRGTSIVVSVNAAGSSTVKSTPADGKEKSSCSVSVCFRPKLAYVVTIDDRAQQTRVQKMLYSPNHAPIMELNISRANFVKKITNVTFDKGMITSVSITKPSEAVGALSIPIDVLKAIIAIPTELIQMKIDTSGKNKDLAAAQKSLIEAQQQLIAARKQAASGTSSDTP